MMASANGPADPSMIGHSGPVTVMSALSTPRPDSAETTCSTVATETLSPRSMVVQSVVIVADAANTGKIYIDDRNGNRMASIAAGQSSTPPTPMGGINLASIYLDASAASQQAYVTYASL